MAVDDHDEVDTQSGIRVRPATRRPRAAFLMVMSSPDASGRMYRLDRDGLTIGRAMDAGIRMDDIGMSRHHASVHVRGEEVEVIDLNSKNGVFYEGERVKSLLLPNGSKFQIGSTIFKVSFQDELDEKLQQSLYESATRDSLTGLYNRRYFEESLGKDFLYCQRRSSPLSVVVFDIDHFKSVNDTYGHSAGDVVLARVGQVLLGGIRSEDVCARIGGEEFALLLRECPEADAVRLADRLRSNIENTDIESGPEKLRVTLSAGVSSSSHLFRIASDLVQAADRNLYRAKEGGRNRVFHAVRADAPRAP